MAPPLPGLAALGAAMAGGRRGCSRMEERREVLLRPSAAPRGHVAEAWPPQLDVTGEASCARRGVSEGGRRATTENKSVAARVRAAHGRGPSGDAGTRAIADAQALARRHLGNRRTLSASRCLSRPTTRILERVCSSSRMRSGATSSWQPTRMSTKEREPTSQRAPAPPLGRRPRLCSGSASWCDRSGGLPAAFMRAALTGRRGRVGEDAGRRKDSRPADNNPVSARARDGREGPGGSVAARPFGACRHSGHRWRSGPRSPARRKPRNVLRNVVRSQEEDD